MGGLVTTVIRTSKNEVFSFKLNTNYWSRVFLNPNILNEVYTLNEISKIENLDAKKTKESHEEYKSGGCLKAPFEYGILYIDYIDNQIYSLNDYAPFSYLTSQFLLGDHKDLHGITIEQANNSPFSNDYIRLVQFLQHDIEITLKDNTFKEKNVDKLISIIEKISPRVSSREPLNVSNVSNIKVHVNNWNIYEENTEKEEFKKMYKLFQKDLNLTQDEIELWDKSINTKA
jgi:hypothetical protein